MYGQWTREPKPLAKGVAKSTFSFLLDLLFALLPIPFLALGVLASKQDRVEFEHASNAHAIMGAAKYVCLTLTYTAEFVLIDAARVLPYFPSYSPRLWAAQWKELLP